MLRSLFQSKVNAAKFQAIGNVQQAASKTYFKYVAIFSVLVVLYAAICHTKPENILYFYIGFQAYAMFMGMIHVWQMGRRFGWKNRYSFIEKLEMTLLVLLVTFILTAIVVYFSPLKPFFLLMPTALFIFIFPMLLVSVFDFAMAIPPEEFKKWSYPIKVEIPDMDKIDFANSYVLTFEVYKKDNERLPTFMKFKAPVSTISFGDLFFMYLYEYNEANRESPIEYMDAAQKRYEWLFYEKPKHWWNEKRMVDPSLTIRENKIKENGIIIPYRV